MQLPLAALLVLLIASRFEIVDIQESPLIQGLRAIKKWIFETIRLTSIGIDDRAAGV